MAISEELTRSALGWGGAAGPVVGEGDDEETVGFLDEALARRTYQRLVAYDARVAVVGRPLDAVRGTLALRLGRVDEAESHFRNGVRWAQQEGCVIESARTPAGLARVAQQRGNLEDAERLGAAAAKALGTVLPS